MQTTGYRQIAGALALGLLCLPLAWAHGGGGEHGGHMEMDMDMGHDMSVDEPMDESEYPASYFSHPEHAGLLYAHIVLMTLAYVFVLPIAVMFSVAKSRYTLVTQFVFTAMNALGVFLAIIYKAKTPDLYPNNAHHKVGWIVTWVVCAHVLVSLIGRVAGVVNGHSRSHSSNSSAHERHTLIPGSSGEASPSASHAHDYFSGPYRMSQDSGQGTEPNTESLRSGSMSSGDEECHRKEFNEDDGFENMPLESPRLSGKFALKATSIASSRVWKYVDVGYKIVDRIILPFGFIAFTTGIVTCGRFFEDKQIFGGLAHWVKGGVFFWLGLFTLGRWCGSFGELGWAWNIRPRRSQKWRPSAEFVESGLIFFYGSTNIFLEHLGHWGGEWVPQDFEHLSITVLFIGGGLVGILIESSSIRDLLNTPISDATPEYNLTDEERDHAQPPQTYDFSMNPIPALVIFLLGIMMSSHQQSSMISSMIHKQWGNLLTGAAFARGLTYVITYLKPPKSVYPSRPPTELLASFGLISGGIIFMASAADTVEGMIHYELDEMFMYTVTMGLVGLLMAWEVTVLAVKGWAVRKEQRAGRY